MNTFQDYDRRALSKVGSFWYTCLSDTGVAKARMLTEVGALMRYAEPLEQAVTGLTGGDFIDDFNVDLSFLPSDVMQYGSLPVVSNINGMQVVSVSSLTPFSLPSTPQSERDNGQLNNGVPGVPSPLGNATSPLPVLSEGVAFFGLRLPPDLAPIRVASSQGDLLVNQDFFIKNNVILFRRHPSNLFPGSVMCVRAARRSVQSINAPFMGVDTVYGSTLQIAKYLRYDNSVGQWIRAACQAAGVGIANDAGIIRSIVPLEQGCLYITDTETITCDYPHTQLTLNTPIAAGTIPGNVVSFQWGSVPSQTWWAQSFPDGIPLDHLSGFLGLSIPAGGMTVTFLGLSGADMHVGLGLNGPVGTVQAYQAQCKALETITGVFIYKALGLTVPSSPPAVGTVLAVVPSVNFFMTFLLGARMVVITEALGAGGELRRQRFLSFVRTHRPVGIIPLIQSL